MTDRDVIQEQARLIAELRRDARANSTLNKSLEDACDYSDAKWKKAQAEVERLTDEVQRLIDELNAARARVSEANAAAFEAQKREVAAHHAVERLQAERDGQQLTITRLQAAEVR